MKNNLKCLVASLVAMFIFATVSFAQEASKDITFIFFQKDSKIFTQNAQGPKGMDLYITGLNNQQDADAFVTKFKAIKGVENITVSKLNPENKRIASVTFVSNSSRQFLKDVLTEAGVTQIIIDDKTIKTSDISTN
jgi:hypothetical protein